MNGNSENGNIYALLRGLELRELEITKPQFEWGHNNGIIGLAKLTPENTKIWRGYYCLPPLGTKVYTFGDSKMCTGTEDDLRKMITAYEQKYKKPIDLKENQYLFVPMSRGKTDNLDLDYSETIQEFMAELGLSRVDLLSPEKIDELTDIYWLN